MTGERHFWLFKTEPSCFSFADLQARPDGTEHWDGVRNFQARNYLRDEIGVGDGVLVYHSNIPEPAVVGVAVVVKAGYPDFTARNPRNVHFDLKSTVDRPIWYMVDIRAERPFYRPVSLAELKGHPGLAGMVLLQRSRLSVQPVTPEQWSIIFRLGSGAE